MEKKRETNEKRSQVNIIIVIIIIIYNTVFE